MTDEYFGFSKKFNRVGRDLMVADRGGAEQAVQGFNRLWESHRTREEPQPRSDLSGTCLQERKGEGLHEISNLADLAPGIVRDLPRYQCSNIEFVMDHPSFADLAQRDGQGDGAANFMNPKRLRYKPATEQIVNFINGAQSSLYMENQYFIPKYQLRDALHSARDRGVRVVVFSNRITRVGGGLDGTMTRESWREMESATQGTMRVVPISDLGNLRREGIPTSSRGTLWNIHSKSAVRDHQDVYIGSFNLDALSFNGNLESGAVVRNCAKLARALEKNYDELVQYYNADVKSCASCNQQVPEKNLLMSIFGIFASALF